MANMNFGVNILPKANNTYTLGNSDYKWNIFANTLNNISLTNIASDIQINGTSIVNNNIATIPLASTTEYGVVKIGGGLYLYNNVLYINEANSSQIKAGTTATRPIVPYSQHESVFYGLAKAASDSTQSASSNAVGTYTSSAKTAIQNMLAVAPTANPVFTGSISLGRKANTTIGENSFAVGLNVEASGEKSYAEGEDTQALDWVDHAEGYDTIASGQASHAEGSETVASGWTAHAEGGLTVASGESSHAGGYETEANGDNQYVFGTYNVPDTAYTFTPWTANTLYKVGDKISIEHTFNGYTNTYYYSCITENEDSTFTQSKWRSWGNQRHYVEIVGNGGYDGGVKTFSNARALDWDGNEHLKGDLYINCNDDSSGGTSITEALNKKISITSDTVTGNPCTFNSDVEDIPLKSIKLTCEFSQPGNGDPTPTNVQPITGVSSFYCAHAKKNMAMLRGYSAENKTYTAVGTLSNSYGTTISTTSPESSLDITQSSSTTDYAKNHYRNGYVVFRTDNMVVGQYYDVSFKVTNITSNPLETALSELCLTPPSGGITAPTEVIGNVLIWKNMLYRDTNGIQSWEVRICGISCTISEFMVTPASTNDGVYEPYDGEKLDVTFPALGKNLCNTSVDNIIPFAYSGYDNYTISNGTVYITGKTLFGFKVPVTPLTKYRWSLNITSNITIEAFDYESEPDEIQNADHTCYYTINATEGTITVPEGSNWIVLAFYTTQTDVTISNIQIELGETTTSYEPYTNSVGIGTLDATAGILTVTHMIYTTTWGKGESASIKENNERRRFTAPFVFKNATSLKTGTSNIAPWLWDFDKDTVHFYNHQQYSYVFLPIDTSDDTEIQIMGWLAEPRVISVPPISIKTFKGTNTIWANTNSSIEIENYIDLETIKEYADSMGKVQDVQIDGTSILNNKIVNIPIATANDYSGYRLVQIKSGNGINIASDNCLSIVRAVETDAKAGNHGYRVCTPYWQHCYTFYGLAKAAGDSTQSASSNAVGVYTDNAKTAIQNMLNVAPKTDPIFENSISLGRLSTSTKGFNSIAAGYSSEATNEASFAMGNYSKATANHAHAIGYNLLASSDYITVIGLNNIETTNFADVDHWEQNTNYTAGDFAKLPIIDDLGAVTWRVYRCTTTHTSGSSVSYDNWLREPEYGFIVGSGASSVSRTNAFAVDWQGNGYFSGDVYANATFHTNLGVKLATVNELPSVMTGATSSVAGTSGLVPAPTTTDVDKFLAGDGTYKSGGLPMVILSYGNSVWQDFIDAYNNNVIVYCRASSNSNPASGSQTRMAFMAYVNNATTPTEVEFQYYRSMSSHSATAMGDQVFVYKLTKTGGWSVTTRDASIKQIKMATGSAGSVSWSSNVVTLDSGLPAVTASDNGKILKVVNGAWAVVDP